MIHHRTIEVATQEGNLEILKYCKNKPSTVTSGKLEVFKWLIVNDCEISEDVCNTALTLNLANTLKVSHLVDM